MPLALLGRLTGAAPSELGAVLVSGEIGAIGDIPPGLLGGSRASSRSIAALSITAVVFPGAAVAVEGRASCPGACGRVVSAFDRSVVVER